MSESFTAIYQKKPVQIPLNFTSDFERHVFIDDLFISLIPMPRICESMTSWISRIAISLGEPRNEVLSIIGLGMNEDSEFFIQEHTIRHLEQLLGVHMHNFRIQQMIASRLMYSNRDSFSPFRRAYGWYYSRFCPLCMNNDIEAFFRFEWCLEFVRYCPTHGCLLEESCPHCRSQILQRVCPAKQEKRSVEVGLLSECPFCGQLLFMTDPVYVFDQYGQPTDILNANEITKLRNGMALLSALAHGYCYVGNRINRIEYFSPTEFCLGGFLPNVGQFHLKKILRQHADFFGQPLAHRLKKVQLELKL